MGAVAGGLGLSAAVPVLDHLFPSALQTGTTNTVTAVGKFDPWPPRIWQEGGGVRWTPTTNAGVFEVVVDPGAVPGVRFVRAVNDEGATAPRFLTLTTGPQPLEVEPNGESFNAQLLPPGTSSINGRLEKNGDVDLYAVDLEPGQTLVADLEAYRLMSPLDPVLRLLDPRGVMVAWNHDDPRSMDPFLAWTAERAGRHLLQVFAFPYPADAEIRFAGNPKGIYRLKTTAGPFVRFTQPLGIQRGASTRLEPVGWSLDATNGAPRVLDGSVPEGVAEIELPLPRRPWPLWVPVGEGPERMELEPNGTVADAMAVEVPSAVSGDLDRAGDVDRFRITVAKGDVVVFDVRAIRLGFPLDAWLAVEDASGKELARVDDASAADPRLEWTAPADGVHVVAVGNLLQRGGRDQRYRLGLERPRPSIHATVAGGEWVLERGRTNEIKVVVDRRHGFKGVLAVSATGLPAGVSAAAAEVSEKGGETVLRLVTAAEAPTASGPFRLVVTETPGGRVHEVFQELVSAGENNGVPQGFRTLVRDRIADLWLTVPPPPPTPPAPKEAKAKGG